MTFLGIVPLLAALAGHVDPLVDFSARVDAYAALRREIATNVTPRLRPQSDAVTIDRACEVLALSLIRARPNARMGELFSPAVSGIIRERVRRVATPEAMRSWYYALYSEGQTPPRRRVTVHSRAPVDEFSPVVPFALLHVLPALPPELAYRLAGRDLLLVDPDASLVIDVLPEVLPRVLHP